MNKTKHGFWAWVQCEQPCCGRSIDLYSVSIKGSGSAEVPIKTCSVSQKINKHLQLKCYSKIQFMQSFYTFLWSFVVF